MSTGALHESHNIMPRQPQPIRSSDGSSPPSDASLGIRHASSRSPEQSDHDIRRIGLVHLSILALIVGVVTGFGAVVFRDLIGLIHNMMFLGKTSVRYDANLFTPGSPWGPLVILVPVV